MIGTWHIKTYIAANLTNGQPNDTLIATHNEVFTFTKDSLFTDSWLNIYQDHTVNPPVVSLIDTIEHKSAYAYTRNGSKYTIKSSINPENVYIVTLTTSQLTTDEKLQENVPGSICKDLFINFEK